MKHQKSNSEDSNLLLVIFIIIIAITAIACVVNIVFFNLVNHESEPTRTIINTQVYPDGRTCAVYFDTQAEPAVVSECVSSEIDASRKVENNVQ